MISSETPYRLIGAADPLDRGLGFLTPVFSHALSNALLIQRTADDGRVMRYDTISPEGLPIVPLPQSWVGIGLPAYWAFGFDKADVVFGQGNSNKDVLAQRLDADKQFFVRFPFIATEVADFLDRSDATKFATAAYHKLADRNSTSAMRWRDLSVLTPKLRARLTHIAKSSEAKLAAQRLTARVSDDEVEIRGLTTDGERPTSTELSSAVQHVMGELATLYPAHTTWTTVARRSAKRRYVPRLHDLSSLQALLWFSDIESFGFSDDVQFGMGLYDRSGREQFEYQQSEYDGPSFIVFDLDPTKEDVRAKSQWTNPSRIFLGLAQRTSSASQLTSAERAALDRCALPTIVLPSRTSSPFNRPPLSAEIRDCVATLTSSDLLLPERSVFFRANGGAPYPTSDAWAQIFDRASSLGVDSNQGVALSRASADSELRPILFPQLELRPLDPWRISIDAAAFIDLNPDDQHVHATDKSSLLVSLFRATGWRALTDSSRRTVRISGTQADFDVTHDLADRGGRRYDFRHLMETDLLTDITRLVVSDKATAGTILSNLMFGDLQVTVRDLASFRSDSNLWSLLGLQMRRFVNSLPSRTRTHYFALLCQAAVQRERIDVSDAEWFVRTINDFDCGESWHFATSRYRVEDDRYSVRLRTNLTPYANSSPTSEEFILHLTTQGPSVVGLPRG